MTARNWLIDFDETLASGNITWAMETAFPKLIQQHRLAYDPARLHQAMLEGQEMSNRGEQSPTVLVHHLFAALEWPHELEQQLLDDVMNNYQPTLFADSLPFLTALKRLNKRVLVISNNPMSRKLITLLEIEGYIDAIYTPEKHPGALPKPHRSLWDVVLAADPGVTADNSAVVGDDPWSDGSFALNCGIPCWIVDRKGRFTHLQGETGYHWVAGLLDIPLEDA